jgi:4-amino-4-deoxy-L-arabinose transferase-like glycosyltransferase
VSSDSIPYPGARAWGLRGRTRGRVRVRVERLFARPELLGLLGVTAVLNLWNLSINGWANTYYSAAVRSMSTNWHDFLYVSLDKTGLMTVDKPPLALWVEALSARVFGFHPLSILVPEALMGVAAVALLYDLVARRFGRAAGFVAGLAFAVTPVTVAIARHNNPDELLLLCSVAAVWAGVRALERGRTRWLVLSGVFVGLGFETKMGVALMVVPGIAAAWMWVAPRGRLVAIRQLLAGGAAMVAVAGAWPLLVTLTPAADRPWISGTSDNSIWSLIFGYNGVGRVAGQSGGPGGAGGGGTMFGGQTGLFRLLQTGLGDQAGWLLGFSLVAGAGILVLTRLRRRDPRTGWLIMIGGAFLVTAVVFSFASGIFHPYYVSLLAPFAAALVGAGVGLMLPASLGGAGRARTARVLAPLAIAAGVVTELIVLGETGGALSWAGPLIVAVGAVCAVALSLRLPRRVHAALVGVALAALLAAPATWAAETLGHATSSTFPAGGPVSAAGNGPGGFAGRPGGGGFPAGGFGGGGGFPGGAPPAGGVAGGPPAGGFGGSAFGGGAGPGGGGFGGASSTVTAAVRYVAAHGGGTIGVSSQSSAATVILSSNGSVAGLGGFSGRESSVTAGWIASKVSSGQLRWLLVSGTQTAGIPGDTRAGSQSAFTIAESVARKVTVTSSSGTTFTLYDLQGKAAAILSAAGGR